MRKRSPLVEETYGSADSDSDDDDDHHARFSDIPIPPSELTTEEIENGSLFKKRLDLIVRTEMTLQDRIDERFETCWRLTENMEEYVGVLVRRTRCGQGYYAWGNDADGWSLDEEMWRTFVEIEDDFYRRRDVKGQFGDRENEWYVDQRRSLDSLLEVMDWDVFYALPDSK